MAEQFNETRSHKDQYLWLGYWCMFLRTFACNLSDFAVQKSRSLREVQRQQRRFWTQQSYYSTSKIAPILKGGETMFKEPLLQRREL